MWCILDPFNKRWFAEIMEGDSPEDYEIRVNRMIYVWMIILCMLYHTYLKTACSFLNTRHLSECDHSCTKRWINSAPSFCKVILFPQHLRSSIENVLSSLQYAIEAIVRYCWRNVPPSPQIRNSTENVDGWFIAIPRFIGY